MSNESHSSHYRQKSLLVEVLRELILVVLTCYRKPPAKGTVWLKILFTTSLPLPATTACF